MWNRSLMPTPSSLVCCPSVATRRMVSPALGCFACNVWSADTISRPWLLVRVRSPLSNECRSRANSNACWPFRCAGPALKCAPEKSSFIGVGMFTSIPPISSTICWKLGKLARITQVMGTFTTDDTASASARRSLPPGLLTMYELSLAPPGPSVSRGMSISVADLSAGFTPITWMASARPGSSGDCDGSSERAPVPRTRAKNGCWGPPVTCAVPTLATWSHVAPCAGTGRPTSSQAVVTMPATSSPHTSGATTSSVMARRRAGVRPLVLWRVTWLLPWSRWTRWSWSGCRDRHPRGSRPCCRR